MGSRFEFTCDKCGYRVQVVGGKDCGMVAVVETMVCRSCRELVDVLVGRYGKEGPTGDPDYDAELGLCPKCRGREVSAWGEPRRCPKCGGRMIRGRLVALWD